MRRTRSWQRAALAAGFALTLLASAPAEATVAIQLDRAQLVEMSDLVVRATVSDVRCTWSEDRARIVSLTRLRVNQYLTGGGESELVLRQFGGEVDGLVSRISGEAYLTPGQEVVLCLRRGAGVVYLTAMSQAVWYVDAPQGAPVTVHRDLSGLTLAERRAGRVEVIEHPTPDPRETLAQLSAHLRALALTPRAPAPVTVERGR